MAYKRMPNPESVRNAIAIIGEFLEGHGVNPRWGGDWNRSLILDTALAAWLDSIRTPRYPSEAQLTRWIERYRSEYLEAEKPEDTQVYIRKGMMEAVEKIGDMLRDADVDLIYFGQERYSFKLIFALAVWRYAEEIAEQSA